MFRRINRIALSLTGRLVISHVLVALLTGVIVTGLLLAFIWVSTQNIAPADYRDIAKLYAPLWLFGEPDGQPNDPLVDPMPGYTLVAAPDDTILWTRGETRCRAGARLDACAPELAGMAPGETVIEGDGEQRVRVVLQTVTGQRVLMERGAFTAEPALIVNEFVIYGYGAMMLFEVVSRLLLAIPVALAVAWLIARPQIRRLSAITQTSRQFAAGALDARVRDRHPDEVGQLARQFDDMAAALAHNIGALRDLAERNADLARQAEAAAARAERARISRDLHDAIAQRLFSLSVSTTALPDLIERDHARGVQGAREIAALAEQTLLDLRALLIELRPAGVAQQGLGEALRGLCAQAQAVHGVRVECSIMLSGGRVPAVAEDALYHIAQEALSNAVRHAQARLVQLTLVEGQRQVLLSVADDGIGFDPDQAPADGRFGLMSMRERAQSLGGRLNVESDGVRGTTVQVVLPLQRGEIT